MLLTGCSFYPADNPVSHESTREETPISLFKYMNLPELACSHMIQSATAALLKRFITS